MKILCVAEKPSIAKTVANILGGGRVTTRNTENPYIKNYDFTYRFPAPFGESEVTMTSVLGHITAADFTSQYRQWHSCAPGDLFHSQITVGVADDKKSIAKNIRNEARWSQGLMIWTDCDREGEHIGMEVVQVARESNRNIIIKRARFSNLERGHIHGAAQRLSEIDIRQSDAVDARIEIDLRLGAAFTRFQTLTLRNCTSKLSKSLISYGSCQFPTLGFIVDRFKRVQSFRPEKFWYINLSVEKDDIITSFKWKRNHLFDRMAVTILAERSLSNGVDGRIVSVIKRPTSKWRPLPLTTVELQRRGSLFLGMSAKKVMDIAEALYTKGFVSYPRTETDLFEDNMDLLSLIKKQINDSQWGEFASRLVDGGEFKKPRNGKHNDHAHPPIHPVAHVSPPAIDREHHQVYILITRHFLACCAEDAKGESTEVSLDWGGERFSANGLRVIERNYLDVYPYDRWENSQIIPTFIQGEMVPLRSATIEEGSTTAPTYLTEPELIQLMDANGIGTDATMADHIETILNRQYAVKVPKGALGRFLNPIDIVPADAKGSSVSKENPRSGRSRGSGRGRGGRGRGRGGASNASNKGNGSKESSTGGAKELIPTTLGTALVEGYDQIGFDKSLTKPFLRRDMEKMMKDICEGRKTKQQVIKESITMYEDVFERANLQVQILREACKRYIDR
ncbi:DNA topoisomerase [Dipodascopsis uninucleata]